jgi:membrane-associated phospholipid phosphatase
MRTLVIGQPPAVDARIRRAATTRAGQTAGLVMSPLFPVGLPGGYLAIAYTTARWLRRRKLAGGSTIVASAWLGWILHRAIKVAIVRRRPSRRGNRPRFDSFPSGHTTGATALALTTAAVLHRDRVLSARDASLLAIGAPLVMGAYRVVADDHWATDVVGGWALGSAIALLALKGPRKGRRGPRRVRRARPTS